jgi:hypothetical protein
MNYFEPDGMLEMERDEQAARERSAEIHDREMEEEQAPTGEEDPTVVDDAWKRERERIEQLRKEEESQSS